MPAFHLQFMGRLGNCAVQFLFAKAFCELNGHDLYTDEWLGEKIFDLEPRRWIGPVLPVRNEFDIRDSDGDIAYRSYSQQQRCASYYTATKCREWLKFRRAAELADGFNGHDLYAVAHTRRGDYRALGYPMPGLDSYLKAATHFGVDTGRLIFVGDEIFANDSGDPVRDLEEDLYRMASSAHLFRANSTLSFVAGILNTGRVFSPIIDGLEGGKEHDCVFVEGNWPRLANFEFTTDLHVAP